MQATAETFLPASFSLTQSLRWLWALCFIVFIPPSLDAIPSEKNIQQLGLTSSEVAWLATHPIIRLGFDTARPPYDFLGENGEHQGVLSSYFNHVESLLGITFLPTEFSSWKTMLEAARHNHIDVVSGLMKTPERETFLLFSDPLFEVSLSIATRREIVLFEPLNELEGKRVGMVESYATIPLVKEKYPCLEIVEVPNLETGLAMVKDGRLSAMISENFALQQLLTNRDFHMLYIAHSLPLRYTLRVGTHKHYPTLHSILQKSLRATTQEERKSFWLTWIRQDKPAVYTSELLVTLGLLLLLLSLWLAYKLRLQKKRIQNLISQLKISKRHVRVAAKTFNVGTWVWVVNDNKNFINHTYANMLGYTKKELDETFDCFTSLISPEDLPLMYTALKRHVDGVQTYYDVRIRMRHKNGEYRWIHSGGGVLKRDTFGHPEIIGGWHMLVDKTCEDASRYTQSIDPLTTLFSAHCYAILAPFHIQRARKERSGIALLLFQATNAQAIKEAFSEAEKDELIKAVGLGIKGELTQPSGFLFRMSEDIFCMLFWCDDKEEVHESETKILNRLKKIELFVQGTLVTPQVKSGHAFMLPGSYVEEDTLYHQAYDLLQNHSLA
jgi:ABC-type amino acid transport substrate-binding protein/GGDEF domain-containing protein